MGEAILIMLWPLIACLLLPGLLVYLGLHVVRRGIIFVDLALAQVAALGTCVAVLLHYTIHDWQTYAFASSFTLVGSVLFTLLRTQEHRMPQEALIGIVYVVAAAGGILLLSRSPEGNEELRRMLIGDVLLVRPNEVLKTFALYLIIGGIHWWFRRQFLAISFDPENARRSGFRVMAWDFWFYVLFGFVVTSFVQIGGVLLVFSFLIIPAVSAGFLIEPLGAKLAVAWTLATVGGILGLIVSYQWDLPTGAAIVCTLAFLLVLCLAWNLMNPPSRRRDTTANEKYPRTPCRGAPPPG
jgi:zinc/manganese transport system permease protein